MTSQGIIFKKNFLVLKDSIAESHNHNYYQFRYFIKNLIFKKTVTLSNEKYLSVIDNWSSGHFHWFCDVLPKIVCLQDETKEYTLVLPDNEYIHRIGIPSLLKMAVQFKNIIFLNEDTLYKIKNLFFVSRVCKSGLVDDEIMKEISNKFNNGLGKPDKLLYISRREASFRKVLNENEIIPVLIKAGFEIIESDRLSFLEHLEIYNNCKTLMGIHGAGLTNGVFMQKGTNICEFIKNSPSDNRCYFHLASSLDTLYYYFIGDADSYKALEGRGSNLFIKPGKLSSFLDTL